MKKWIAAAATMTVLSIVLITLFCVKEHLRQEARRQKLKEAVIFNSVSGWADVMLMNNPADYVMVVEVKKCGDDTWDVSVIARRPDGKHIELIVRYEEHGENKNWSWDKKSKLTLDEIAIRDIRLHGIPEKLRPY